MLKSAFGLTAIILSFLLMGSCGLIPPTPVLYPPEFELFTDSIRLTHNVNNDLDSFYGYKIYYKLYQTREAIESKGDIQSLLDQESHGELNLKNRKFVLVKTHDVEKNLTDDHISLRIENKGTPVSYYIHIAPDDVTLTQAPPPTTDVYSIFGRDTGKVGYASFYDQERYQANDTDIQNMIGSSFSTTDTSYYVVFVAIAYGITTDAGHTRFYSLPATLTVEEAENFDIEIE